MNRNALTLAIGAGLASALLFLSLRVGGMGTMFLVYLAPLPLLAAGLAFGTQAAIVAGAIGTLLVAPLMGLSVTAFYAVAFAAPAWLIVRQALMSTTTEDGSIAWYPVGRLLAEMAGYGVGLMILALLVATPADSTMQGMMESALNTAFAPFLAQGTIPADELTKAVHKMASVLPGFFGMTWLLVMIANGWLAQSLAARFGHALRPMPPAKGIRLPQPAVYALAVFALAGLVAPGGIGYLGLNSAMILALPYLLTGLVVVHAFAATQKMGLLFLVLFYTLALFIWPMLPLVAGLGVIDQWVDIRRRLPLSAPPSEDN